MRRIVAILLVCLLCLSLFSCKDERDSDLLQIYFFDVGQGDATLIRTPGGDVLIDTGTEDSQDLLCLRLEQLGVTEIALMILSHHDEDHVGGADGVLSRFSVGEIWTNGALPENESARRMQEIASTLGVPILRTCAMQMRCIGNTYFTILSPLSLNEVESGNADSLVLKVHFGEISMLFAGDIDADREQDLLDYYNEFVFDCDLYKVAHHGSKNATSERFLHAMSPRYAVISCARENAYGHPSGETLLRLNECGAEIWRTDLHGEIMFWCDGKELRRLTNR